MGEHDNTDSQDLPASTKSALQEMADAWQEAMEKAMDAPGWRYHDLPRLSEEYFLKFVEIAGEDNLRWITLANYPAEDGSTLHRGQVMISPDGVARLAEYAKGLSA